MIHLKKNDKIIVIVGVVILIIAGIGIAMYSPTEHLGVPPMHPDGKYNYDISWETYTKAVLVDAETYAGRGAPFNYELIISDKNILNVIVEISWADDHTYGILFTRGLDTLTADVICRGVTDSWSSVGNGTREFFFSINSMPYDTTVRGDSFDEAMENVMEEYHIEDTISVSIDVDVNPGEPIWRPLKYMRDRGNGFDLTIRYEYYDAYLTDSQMNSDDPNGDDHFNETASDDDPYQHLGKLIIAGLTRW
ncbi:MAG: hypothetical protein R6V50_06240 [Thermoplasmatota archaeon]